MYPSHTCSAASHTLSPSSPCAPSYRPPWCGSISLCSACQSRRHANLSNVCQFRGSHAYHTEHTNPAPPCPAHTMPRSLRVDGCLCRLRLASSRPSHNWGCTRRRTPSFSQGSCSCYMSSSMPSPWHSSPSLLPCPPTMPVGQVAARDLGAIRAWFVTQDPKAHVDTVTPYPP